MPQELVLYITKYGYLAIFSLVFIQEIGFPNPVPNEFVLLFSGFLSTQNILSLPLVILTVVLADFLGTSVLFFVFYSFGTQLLERKPKWLPMSKHNIEHLSNFVSARGLWGIYMGRLIPYLRGYVSVAAGLLKFSPKKFLSMVFLSAITWSGGYVIAGHIAGPYWQEFAQRISGAGKLLGITLIILSAILIWKNIKKWKKSFQEEK
jgi:membrane protein DedA with SNARE-associated domain